MNSYWDRGLERVPTLKSDIEEIMEKYPNSLIGTTACLGGELSANTLALIGAEKTGEKDGAATAHNNIVNFLLWCKEVFGEDNFYIECAPGSSRDQVLVNKRFPAIAKVYSEHKKNIALTKLLIWKCNLVIYLISASCNILLRP